MLKIPKNFTPLLADGSPLRYAGFAYSFIVKLLDPVRRFADASEERRTHSESIDKTYLECSFETHHSEQDQDA